MLIVTLVALSLWAAHLHFSVAGTSLVRRETHGLLSWEVRRRVYMDRPPGGTGRYPEPREIRSRVLRLGGVALWHEARSIALPLQTCQHLAEVKAEDFDSGFPAWLQLHASAAFTDAAQGHAHCRWLP